MSRYLGSVERATVSASVTVLGRLAHAFGSSRASYFAVPHGGSAGPRRRAEDVSSALLRAYCEMKAPTDGDLFDVSNDLAPGEIHVEVRKDPSIFKLRDTSRKLPSNSKPSTRIAHIPTSWSTMRAAKDLPIFGWRSRVSKRQTGGAYFLS
jgi:hypothetical protein